LNSENTGKKECEVKNASKVMIGVLNILKDNKYLGDFKLVETKKGNILEINLIGGINKCGAIKPRFPIKKEDFEKFEKRYLPAKDFGLLIVSTSQGMMTHNQAIEKGIGGKLIAYCY
jgi:small subunit ribosomal protein S8